ncbi:hypothetical protein L6164_000625 [Bauhinia variegata]|uniref:Uncharacterized protein n=1 Tax=Bauhinia variegata TaxID=167791 RepID=A0ACB9Q779_BAUVA|nr:hypothetical protein L6164_000625 [Bauhinia variegata]
MQSPSLQLSKTFTAHRPERHRFGFHHSLSSTRCLFPSLFSSSSSSNFPKSISSSSSRSSRRIFIFQTQNSRRSSTGPKEGQRVKGNKDNVWSVDNELAKSAAEKEKRKKLKRRRMVKKKRGKGGRVLVSGAMLTEVETVLQTQEPVIKPSWITFASSVSGIWKGVGAVFSPLTAEMEPIEISNKSENLYDCYTISRIEAVPSPSGGQTSQIQRKINWVTLNPYGEIPQSIDSSKIAKGVSRDDDASVTMKEKTNENARKSLLPTFESFDFERSDVMEEDVMGSEPGLVYFEDGSYSRGPLDIPVGEVDDTKYYVTPTFKFEQCLVKGCHKRIRIVHTIEFNNGGADIRIMRVAVYEEEWVSPANIKDPSGLEFDVQPLSQRRRTRPSELIGSWKVFEVSATPVFGEKDIVMQEGNGSTPYVYLCTETLKKRSFPEHANSFGEEEVLDMQDVTMLWLPGGVTCYVDVIKDGTLCIGVGWYSEEGINLVMERDYGLDGKLKEARYKSEVKRRWTNPPPM